jgi:predicted DCC family thiol-disulfide oxidoreductase YuxK
MHEPYSYRLDASVPSFPDDKPIIVFDGHCVMCSAWARTLLRWDRKGVFRLLPAQTELGHALYVHFGLDPEHYETNILIEGGRAWLKAEGTIRMGTRLGFSFSMLQLFRLLPARWRDALYELIARNRLALFGRRELCYRSEPGLEERFLP